MFRDNQQNNIYIYKAMTPERGIQVLAEKLGSLPNIAEIKESGAAIWLFRESNTKGYLTMDYIKWNKDTST